MHPQHLRVASGNRRQIRNTAWHRALLDFRSASSPCASLACGNRDIGIKSVGRLDIGHKLVYRYHALSSFFGPQKIYPASTILESRRHTFGRQWSEVLIRRNELRAKNLMHDDLSKVRYIGLRIIQIRVSSRAVGILGREYAAVGPVLLLRRILHVYELPLISVEFNSALVKGFLRQVVEQLIEAPMVGATHRINIFDVLDSEVNHSHRPVLIPVDWDKENVVGEDIVKTGPPKNVFETESAVCHQEKTAECIRFRQAWILLTADGDQIRVSTNYRVIEPLLPDKTP